MLSKKNRLILKKDFERLKKEGKQVNGPLFGILVLAQEDSKSPSRFGFIVSKHLSKKATKRNRARRLLMEAIRKFLPQIKPGHDILFLGKKTLLEKSLVEVGKETKKILKRAKLLR